MNEEGVFWSKAPQRVLDEVIRLGELYLKAQQDIAIAADQRAARLSASLVNLTIALFGAALGAFTAATTAADPAGGTANAWASPLLPLGMAATAAGLLMLVAVWSVLQAVKPSEFHFHGAQPSTWRRDINESTRFEIARAEHCANLEAIIADNEDRLAANAKHIKRALQLAAAAPVLGLAVGLSWVAVEGGAVSNIRAFIE